MAREGNTRERLGEFDFFFLIFDIISGIIKLCKARNLHCRVLLSVNARKLHSALSSATLYIRSLLKISAFLYND